VDSLPEGAIEKYAYAIAQNNLAFALYSSNSDDMEKLLFCANEAYKLLPWENSVRGTYGAALIRSGANLMEGVKHLEAIIRNPMGAKNKTIAINYFCLAEGYKKLGENNRENEAIRRAVTLNPDVARHFM
jgi:predicted Zn-dependent protease